MRRVTVLLLSGGVVSVLGVACGTSTVAPLDASFEVIPQCLTGIEENGKACGTPESLLCYVAIPCDAGVPTPQQGNCNCTGGKWRCTYTVSSRMGQTIPPGAAACVNELEPEAGSDNCPNGEPSSQIPCSQPGLICTYKGITCPDAGEPNTDMCQCAPGDTLTTADGAIVSGDDGGLVWTCDRQLCNPTSDAAIPPPPDAGKPDLGMPDLGSPVEAGKDVKTGG